MPSDIYGGETYDARLEQPGWDGPGFDDSGWPTVRIGETPQTQFIAQTAPPLRPTRTLRAVSVTELVPGRFVFDFGQNMPGWVKLRATGPAGSCITLRFAELLNADGTADQSNLRRAECTDRCILRGEVGGDAAGESFAPRFTYHGFRYVEVEGYPGTPTADDIEAVIVHSDCRETGDMTFASPLLQRIWTNALWSQRSNFFAAFPPTARNATSAWAGWATFKCFWAAQRPDGAYPIVVPEPLSFPDVVTAGWSEAGIILPHGLWQRYGDTAVIDENWAAMEAWMDYLARGNPDHIWRNDRGLDLGDWLSVDAIQPDDETTPRILCATAYWAYSAQLMAQMAQATGRDADAARYAALREACWPMRGSGTPSPGCCSRPPIRHGAICPASARPPCGSGGMAMSATCR